MQGIFSRLNSIRRRIEKQKELCLCISLGCKNKPKYKVGGYCEGCLEKRRLSKMKRKFNEVEWKVK